jgi:hypothetical protein
VYHAGARDLVHEIKAAIVKGEWPPKPKPRPSPFDDLLEDYRAAKARAQALGTREASQQVERTKK